MHVKVYVDLVLVSNFQGGAFIANVNGQHIYIVLCSKFNLTVDKFLLKIMQSDF